MEKNPQYGGQPPHNNQNAPPQYGQPQPQYSQPQPQYSQPPAQYNSQPQPQYGQPQPQYAGQPPPQQYGQPQPQYAGQPPPQQYGQPQYAAMPGVPPVGIQPGAPGQPAGAPAAQWMPMPQGFAGCPPGLEYLTQIDQLLVHQQVELLEVFTNWETCNRYKIKNSIGQQVYFAHEESDTFQRQCCGPARGFTMHITDNHQQEVMRVNREFKCCAGCCWCAAADRCAMEVSVEAPVGTTVGYVRQEPSPCPPRYTIMDANRKELLKINGPSCMCQGICCQGDQDFNVMNMEETAQIGKVSKQWGGYFKETYTTADNFGVNFPMDLDVKVKATMIGVVFLIDFMYFEQKKNNDTNSSAGFGN